MSFKWKIWINDGLSQEPGSFGKANLSMPPRSCLPYRLSTCGLFKELKSWLFQEPTYELGSFGKANLTHPPIVPEQLTRGELNARLE